MGNNEAALATLRVVDFSTGIAGAYCAKLLTEAGADVIVVEPGGGHPLRSRAKGALFAYLRHGQRSVVADDAAGLAATIRDADIVIVEPGGPLGDPERVADAHPSKVVVSISPFGLHGPYAGRAATELTVQAESGALGIRGRPERPPVQAGGQITEWVCGDYAAVGAMAAALELRRSARGDLVDVSWAEVANITCTLFTDLFDKVAGRPDLSANPSPRSFETPSVEPTLDGYVGFNTNTRQQFGDFLVMIGRTDLIDADPTWSNLAVRIARWDEWNAIVHAWTSQHTTDEIVELAALFRIPVAPVTNAATVLRLDQAVERGTFVDDPAATFRMPRRPWMFDGERPPAPRPAPAIGEHTATIEDKRPFAAPSAARDGKGPFAGLKVIDLTGWWAGPSMAAVFANFGADVIHVESTTHPDGIRMAGGAFFVRPQWWELSSFFLASNTNKRGLTLDLVHPDGRQLLLDLIAGADLVVENYTPRVFESFDLGWDVIHAVNPRAVMVRIPAFGLTGPWRDRPGFAQTMEQITGLAWLTGYVDDQPRIQRGPCDPNAGMHAALATMVALVERERTGCGRLVEVPMFDAALAIAAEPVIEWTATGTLLQRNGNRSRHHAPQGVYACAGIEQWLAVTVADGEGWRGLATAIGRPDWADEPSLATLDGRLGRHDEIDAAIAAWAGGCSVERAVADLQAVGVAAAQVVDPRRTSDHPQFLARRFHEMVDHPVAGTLSTPTMPFRLRSVERWVHTPAPTMGQHNAEVLAEIGVDETRLAALAEAGIIGTKPANL